MSEEQKQTQQPDAQGKGFKVKIDYLIYALLCGVVAGLILMGAATIVNGKWSYFLNAISSCGYFVAATSLMCLTFYQKFFCKQKVEKHKLPAKIVVTIIYYAIAALFIFVSWGELLGKDFSDLLFWLVAISWALVSVSIIVRQISLNKQDFENSPLQSYTYILCGMIYAFAYAVILKFDFDVALKIFYTLHTIVALTVFINIIFKFGIKTDNFTQLALFIVSVITLMALLVSTLYFWFWDAYAPDIFASIMGVFAGLLGGVLTLTGVAWTIKRQDEIRQEEERKRLIPYFIKHIDDNKDKEGQIVSVICSRFEGIPQYNERVRIEDYNNFKQGNEYIEILAFKMDLKNAEICKLIKLEINGIVGWFYNRSLIANTNIVEIQIVGIHEIEELKSFKLFAEDAKGNMYEYNIKFRVSGQKKFVVYNNYGVQMGKEFEKTTYKTILLQEIELPILLNK